MNPSATWSAIPRPLRIFAGRLALIIPQMAGVLMVTFLLIRLMPGDPVLLLLGNMATPSTIAAMRERLGIDLSIWEQFLRYVENVFQGDLGTSIFTSHTVVSDLMERAPATLELIIYGTGFTVILGMTLGVSAVIWRGGIIHRFSRVYGLAAGAVPDFWIGLLLIFFIFHLAGWAPAPFGRIDAFVTPPPLVTSFYTIDSLIAGDLQAFASSVSRLFLPVLTLVLVNGGAVMKMTEAIFADVYRSEFICHQRACGVSEAAIARSTLRNILPPMITTIGFLFNFQLGAAVIVETIFSWGGLGQYAVQSVVNSDYPALQGFVLFAALFVLLVYLAVDILYELADPRIKI